jgi:hypothetical protein
VRSRQHRRVAQRKEGWDLTEGSSANVYPDGAALRRVPEKPSFSGMDLLKPPLQQIFGFQDTPSVAPAQIRAPRLSGSPLPAADPPPVADPT